VLRTTAATPPTEIEIAATAIADSASGNIGIVKKGLSGLRCCAKQDDHSPDGNAREYRSSNHDVICLSSGEGG